MIQGFACRETEKIFSGQRSSRLAQDMQKTALRKLMALDQARSLSDLAALPGNRLEPLKGNRVGQYSIRINKQWRLCFAWKENGPENVEIVDYHT